MVCIYCKIELLEGSIYCHKCGKQQKQQTRKRRRRAQSQGSITKLSKRTNPYWARLPADYSTGVPVRKSLGCYPTYNAAANAIAKAIYVFESRESEAPTQVITLQQIYNRFTASHYYEALCKSAQTSHCAAWKHLSGISNIPISQINKDTFQIQIDKMHTNNLKRETMAKVRNLSSLLCKEAIGLGLPSVNYGKLVQLPKYDSTPVKPFTSDELLRLWDAADSGNETAMAVQIMNYTGLRPTEFLNVEISANLHTVGKYWYVTTGIIGSKTKAGQGRIIPLPKILHPLILTLINNRTTGPLCVTKRGGYYRLDNWRPRRFNILMDQLGISGCIPYSCRHTYADLIKRRMVPADIAAAIMGHEDYATTYEYYHSTTADDITYICSAVDGISRP